MNSNKIKAFSISNFDEYVLLSLEKSEKSLLLIEKLLEDLDMVNDIERENLNETDVKVSIVGHTCIEIIFAAKKIFFLTNVQDKKNKEKMMRRFSEETELVKPKNITTNEKETSSNP